MWLSDGPAFQGFTKKGRRVMPIAICYWVLMLLLLIFGALYVWPGSAVVFSANFVMVFLLFLIIGWKLFGRPIQ
jgi:hypothetical protein